METRLRSCCERLVQQMAGVSMSLAARAGERDPEVMEGNAVELLLAEQLDAMTAPGQVVQGEEIDRQLRPVRQIRLGLRLRIFGGLAAASCRSAETSIPRRSPSFSWTSTTTEPPAP